LQGNLKTTKIRDVLKKPFFNTKLHGMFDVIVCNFAFHYFIKSAAVLNRILNEIYLLLKIGGLFIMTAHDAHKILELFNNNNVKYNEKLVIGKNKVYKDNGGNDEPLFTFKRLFKGNRINKAGQEIAVFVESIGQEHNEYLVNFEEIINIMTSKGKFTVLEDKSFKDKYEQFQEKRKLSLSETEKIFSFTNRFLVFKKNYVKETRIKKSRKKIINTRH